jgi:hypothetical protein
MPPHLDIQEVAPKRRYTFNGQTRRYIPQINNHRCDNLKSYIVVSELFRDRFFDLTVREESST